MVISDDGLFELLSPSGFALGAALAGHDVSLYFQASAVRVLARSGRGAERAGTVTDRPSSEESSGE